MDSKREKITFEKKEIERIQEEALVMGELMVLKYRFNINDMKKNGHFDRIMVSSGKKFSKSLLETRDGPTFTINFPVSPAKSVYFEKIINSVNLTPDTYPCKKSLILLISS